MGHGLRVVRRIKNRPIYGAIVEMRVDLPVPLALEIDEKKVERFVGNRIARVIRGRLRKGIDGNGSALPMPKDGRPGRQTGSMLRSIKYNRKLGRVEPSSRIRKDKAPGDRVNNNYAIMSVHINSGRWVDPMGAESSTQQAQIVDDVNSQLQKQIDRGAFKAKRGGAGARGRRGRR